MDEQLVKELKEAIREIPDWPKKGILFYDVTTLLKEGRCFEKTINALIEPYRDKKIDLVLGIEARGFIFAPTVAYALKAGFVPVRKPGKLSAQQHLHSFAVPKNHAADRTWYLKDMYCKDS